MGRRYKGYDRKPEPRYQRILPSLKKTMSTLNSPGECSAIAEKTDPVQSTTMEQTNQFVTLVQCPLQTTEPNLPIVRKQIVMELKDYLTLASNQNKTVLNLNLDNKNQTVVENKLETRPVTIVNPSANQTVYKTLIKTLSNQKKENKLLTKKQPSFILIPKGTIKETLVSNLQEHSQQNPAVQQQPSKELNVTKPAKRRYRRSMSTERRLVKIDYSKIEQNTVLVQATPQDSIPPKKRIKNSRLSKSKVTDLIPSTEKAKTIFPVALQTNDSNDFEYLKLLDNSVSESEILGI